MAVVLDAYSGSSLGERLLTGDAKGQEERSLMTM